LECAKSKHDVVSLSGCDEKYPGKCSFLFTVFAGKFCHHIVASAIAVKQTPSASAAGLFSQSLCFAGGVVKIRERFTAIAGGSLDRAAKPGSVGVNQLVIRRQEEAGGPRISLPSTASDELTIDATGRVTLGADYVQPT
jgi:hypothetical protein